MPNPAGASALRVLFRYDLSDFLAGFRFRHVFHETENPALALAVDPPEGHPTSALFS
jgi:hypothetical protein